MQVGPLRILIKQEGKKRSGENPEENTEGFIFEKERPCKEQAIINARTMLQIGPASCLPGDDRLDIGEVEAFVIFGEAIVIYGKDMVITQVERASGE